MTLQLHGLQLGTINNWVQKKSTRVPFVNPLKYLSLSVHHVSSLVSTYRVILDVVTVSLSQKCSSFVYISHDCCRLLCFLASDVSKMSPWNVVPQE